MSICDTCIQDDGGTWSAEHCAVWVEQMANADGSLQVMMLRHPSYPYPLPTAATATLIQPPSIADFEAMLQAVALEYIKAVQVRAGISQAVVDAFGVAGGPFGWLTLGWGAGVHGTQVRDPRWGFWVQRQTNAGLVDRTVVLLAGHRVKGGGPELGGEVGLRVVMHLSALSQGKWGVRITGMSMSNLPAKKDIDRIGTLSVLEINAHVLTLEKHFGFEAAPAVSGVALYEPNGGKRTLRLFGVGSRGTNAQSRRSEAFVSDQEFGDLTGTTVRTVSQVEQLSHAGPDAEVFERDPASCNGVASLPKRRPTRPVRELDKYRHATIQLPPESMSGGQPTGLIELKDHDGRFEVRQTRVGNDRGDPLLVEQVPIGNPVLRSDDLAATHAYARGRELFERAEDYGLDPDETFRLVKWPLQLRHRAPIRGAGDSKTVNAQVRPIGDGASYSDDPGPASQERAELEVCFAAANLAHRRLLANDAQRQRAQPLGLAADQRWAWHEFGHVLAFASTGALEFRFAHSAGDALAAIVADPDNGLRTAADPESYAGMSTFPWVRTPRRHDRDASLGWCWCGRRNVLRLVTTAQDVREQRLGYFQEQVLSSSLFRLYRSIGGDTFSRPAVRRSAADYAVYLIMRAIALLGPKYVVPGRTADQFVSVLMDADVGTREWDITAHWPERDPARNLSRVGGCVYKVIRWAFEMQGLFATEDPLEVKEGPGQPPCVDIYIADRREGAPGGYHAVPLLPNDGQNPKWHASAQAIALRNGQVEVTVENRGRITAEAVTVRARWSPATGAPVWKDLQPSPSAPQDVPKGTPAVFTFAAEEQPGVPLQLPYRIWASATCPADRANDDPETNLPCTQLPTPFVDLVANDNNQGYRRINQAS